MFSRIVVGTDGSETAKQAVREATELAKKTGASLDIVSAYDPVPSRATARGAPRGAGRHRAHGQPERGRRRDARRGGARGRGGRRRRCDTFARQGEPADAILDVAEEENADLIVVGNKGMTGAKRFLLGSVPNKVSHHAPSSVLIVRTS